MVDTKGRFIKLLIGREKPEDRGEIPLRSPLPPALGSSFQEQYQLSGVLGLDRAVDQRLHETDH
jgi:hypothetical protein